MLARASTYSGRLRRHSLLGSSAVLAALVLAMIALIGPVVWSTDPLANNPLERLQNPSLSHPAGTDLYGRDILARLLTGARWTLLGACLVSLTVNLVGLAVAMLATTGRTVDITIGRLLEALLAVPGLVIALALTSILGPSFRNLLFALSLSGWPWYARLYRGVILTELSREYIEGARALGASRSRLLFRHVLPNIVGPVLVLATANLGFIMLNLAALSFLGLGIQPPTPEWGAMVSESRTYLQSHPWQVIAPGAAIMLAVLVVNLTGDALRDRLDPRFRV